LIFVPVKKKLKYIPAKKNLFEKGPWSHQNADCATFGGPLQRFGGARDLFQTKKYLQGCFSKFYFTGTKIIFKPIVNNMVKGYKK